MNYADYSGKIDAIFRRFTRNGYADYFACRGLTEELTELICDAGKEFPARGEYAELFRFTCRLFLKWDKTDKDDSDGETQYICSLLSDNWDIVYNADNSRIPHSKMYDWFVSKLDGSLMDYMEDYLYDYIVAQFKDPDLLQKKYDFYQEKIREAEAASDDFYSSYRVGYFRESILKILADMHRPIEEIREYARSVNSPTLREVLADIERQYGNTDQVIAIYRELAEEEDRRGFPHGNWHIKLKEIFKEIGNEEECLLELKAALLANVGNRDLWKEYKSLYSSEEWPSARDAYFSLFDAGDARLFPWYAIEGRYDLIMAGIERKNMSDYIKDYEKKLKASYPERCLAVIVNDTIETADRAKNRKGYRYVARMLSWMCKYPAGREKASKLAESFRLKYPRRTALLDEIRGF